MSDAPRWSRFDDDLVAAPLDAHAEVTLREEMAKANGVWFLPDRESVELQSLWFTLDRDRALGRTLAGIVHDLIVGHDQPTAPILAALDTARALRWL